MNKKIFKLGIDSGLIVEDSKESHYGYSISEYAEIDDVVEYASRIIEDCMNIVMENTNVFDISDRARAIRRAKRRIFSHFYGESDGE
jgi:hypothetical protein